MLQAGLSAWTASEPSTIPTEAGRDLYMGNTKTVDDAVIRTLAAMAVVVALVFCRQVARSFTPANPHYSLIENVLLMMGFASGGRPYQKAVKCLNRLWILYADHEMTNSTAAFLHIGSTLADPLSCAVASITSAYGPLHAGAIDLAYATFERIGDIKNLPQLIEDVKAKKVRLYGYGHRIYKTRDSRVKFIREIMDDLSTELALNPVVSVAMEIDRIASTDPYFVSRNLYTNADLYGCFVYSGLYVIIFDCIRKALLIRC